MNNDKSHLTEARQQSSACHPSHEQTAVAGAAPIEQKADLTRCTAHSMIDCDWCRVHRRPAPAPAPQGAPSDATKIHWLELELENLRAALATQGKAAPAEPVAELSDAEILSVANEFISATIMNPETFWTYDKNLIALGRAYARALLSRRPVQDAAPEWDYCPECGEEGFSPTGYDNGRFCAACVQEWFPDIDYRNVVRGHLSERKAPAAPLAALERLQQAVIDIIESRPTEPNFYGWNPDAVREVKESIGTIDLNAFVHVDKPLAAPPGPTSQCKDGGWISVTERLPAEHKEVLAWREDSGPFTAKRISYFDDPDTESESETVAWLATAYGWQDGAQAPTHWMPLPPAPDMGGKA